MCSMPSTAPFPSLALRKLDRLPWQLSVTRPELCIQLRPWQTAQEEDCYEEIHQSVHNPTQKPCNQHPVIEVHLPHGRCMLKWSGFARAGWCLKLSFGPGPDTNIHKSCRKRTGMNFPPNTYNPPIIIAVWQAVDCSTFGIYFSAENFDCHKVIRMYSLSRSTLFRLCLVHTKKIEIWHGKGSWSVDVHVQGANNKNGDAGEDHVVPFLP